MSMPVEAQHSRERAGAAISTTLPVCVANNRDLTENTRLTRKYNDQESKPRQPDCGELHMEDEDEDVFVDRSPWQTPFRREINDVKSENRATQTPGPTLLLGNGMLPCGIAQEPRQLYHGSAALQLLRSAHIERVGEAMAEDQWGHADPPQQPVARSAEVEIGQKLQLIGDQFHQEQLQLFQRNQRHQRQPFVWRLAWALYTLLFERPVGREPR